jgi:hypothetical protein
LLWGALWCWAGAAALGAGWEGPEGHALGFGLGGPGHGESESPVGGRKAGGYEWTGMGISGTRQATGQERARLWREEYVVTALDAPGAGCSGRWTRLGWRTRQRWMANWASKARSGEAATCRFLSGCSQLLLLVSGACLRLVECQSRVPTWHKELVAVLLRSTVLRRSRLARV